MKKKKIFKIAVSVYLLLATLSTGTIAQDNNQKSFEWAEQMGGKGRVLPEAIVSDSKDNIYIGGSYSKSLKKSSGEIENLGSKDLFIAKYTPDGKQKWLWNAGGSGVDNVAAMLSDEDENIWFTGKGSEGMKFGKSKVKDTGRFLYLARSDAKGKASLVQQIEYTALANINALVFGADGSIIIGGNFNDTLAIGKQQLVSKGNKDIFIIEFDRSGNVKKLSAIGGEGDEILSGIALDERGNMFIGGLFSASFSINSKRLIAREKGSYKNSFIAKFDTNDEAVWIETLHSEKYVKLVGLKTDVAGAVYICGDFIKSMKLADKHIEGIGEGDIFTAKFNKLGELQWERHFGSTDADYVNTLHLDKRNGLVLSGSFHDSIRIGETDLLSETKGLKAFVAQISREGEMLWADKIAGEGNKLGKSSVMDSEGNLFLTGSFSNTLERESTRKKAIGEEDVFLAKFHYCLQSEKIIQAEKSMLCPGEELDLRVRDNVNNIVWNDTLPDVKQIAITDSGTYNVQYTNNYGCQVRDTIQIKRAPAPEFSLGNDTVIYTHEELVLESPVENPQRIWHDNTSEREFIVRSSNDQPHIEEYSLQVWDSLGCHAADTIQVEFIQNTNWYKLTGNETIVCYPNPVHDVLNWQISTGGEGSLVVNVARENGRVVYQEEIPNYKSGEVHTINMSSYKAGVYILSLRDGNKTITTSIVHK